jgi:lambda repressor-like predicted transcriptional regulator
MMKLETKIKIKLLEAGITGAEIARRAKVDRTAIYHVIAGRSKSVKLRRAIAKALGVDVVDLWPNNHKRAA